MNKRQSKIKDLVETMLNNHHKDLGRNEKETWYLIKVTYDPINEYLVLNGYLDTFILAKLISKFDLFIDQRVLIPCFQKALSNSTIETRIETRVKETRTKHRRETK